MKTANIIDVITFRRNNPSAEFISEYCTFKSFNKLAKDGAVLIQEVTYKPSMRVSYYA